MQNFFSSVFGGRRRRSSSRNDDDNGQNNHEFDNNFFWTHQFQQQQQQQRGAPPASKKAMRQLPTVTVTPEDLVEESNRECCICLEENHLKDRVTRLPCAHIYHSHCILDWLSKHCTCPVCRYELATNNVEYERGRLERMKHRKPRFARYELERMSIKELIELCLLLMVSTRGAVSKDELIQIMIDSNKIDLVVAPKPVEYPLSLLRAMGVGELRRTMADAGVFFDPIDVVEKQDMVQIFVNSGRLELVPEVEQVEEENVHQEECKKPAAADTPTVVKKRNVPVVETVTESDNDDDDGSNRPPFKRSSRSNSMDGSDHRQTCFMEYNQDFVEQNNDLSRRATARPDFQTKPVVDNNQGAKTETAAENGETSQVAAESEAEEITGAHAETPQSSVGEAEGADGVESPQVVAVDNDRDVVMEDAFESDSPTHGNDQEQSGQDVSAAHAQFHERSISELREIARERGIDISDCIERKEMVDRLVSAPARVFHFADFDSWTVSALRGTARALGVDLSQCTDRTDMVERLVEVAGASQPAANYLDTLTPIMQLSVSELRAVAREWHVNVSDCLEKDEMIDRLVVAGGPQRVEV